MSIINITINPIKKNKSPLRKPIVSILVCSNSTNEIKIITPAENPIMKERNFGLGLFRKKVRKLPMDVDRPANRLKDKASTRFSIV